MNYDFMRYLITRYEPGDGPQSQIVGFLMVPVWGAGPQLPYAEIHGRLGRRDSKQTLYEVSRDQFTRSYL